MRCIAYVSRAPISDRGVRLPKGLSDIVVVSRRVNPLFDITGIISYRREQFFQVLEGPHQAVSDLMAKIEADPRHEDVWVFLDVRITKRSFGNWGVSVFDFVDQGPFFKDFIYSNRHIINSFTDEQKARIEAFIELDKIYNNANKTDNDTKSSDNRYNGKLLRLNAWPDLNNISDPQLVIELSVKLTKKPYAFDRLINDDELGTREQITTIIENFEKLGILVVTEPILQSEPVEVALVEKQVSKPKKPSRFMEQLKSS